MSLTLEPETRTHRGAASQEELDRSNGVPAKAVSSSPFPAQAELDAAIAHFRSGSVGAPQKYLRPFTRQLKSDTALRFPIDQAYFDRANAVQRQVVGSYLRLRMTTLVLYALLVLIQASAFLAGFGSQQSTPGDPDPAKPLGSFLAALPLPPEVGAASLILISAVAFFGLRIATRRLWFRELSRDAHQLSFEVFKRLDDINTRVTEVCAHVRDRVGEGGSWSERARKWLTIALWNAKRGEYLDRFITTVIWKVQTSIQDIEILFLCIKLALAVAATLAVARNAPLAALPFGLLLLSQAYFLWHRLGRQPADFWTIQFRKSAPEDDHGKETYVDKISRVVENLVHEALSKEFGQGGKQGG
jgi:hypothetical protein